MALICFASLTRDAIMSLAFIFMTYKVAIRTIGQWATLTWWQRTAAYSANT